MKAYTIFHFYQISKQYCGEIIDECIDKLQIPHCKKITNSEGVFLNLQPIATHSINFHQMTTQTSPEKGKIDYILANTRGLITIKRNKCKFLREVTMSNNGSQIIGLTKTWVKDNLDDEILRYFKEGERKQRGRQRNLITRRGSYTNIP